ncbi:hypothetical protein W02_27350 [Nitrospira sp. KM1]|nr:hypothetical protein W02_27350 [Nitrospira sp. KM1]
MLPDALKVGSRIRLLQDYWPWKEGAIATVLVTAENPDTPCMLIRWVDPNYNYSPDPISKLSKDDQLLFELEA